MNLTQSFVIAAATADPTSLLSSEPSTVGSFRMILQYALTLGGFIGVLGIFLVPVGIILLITSTDEKRPQAKRKKLKKWGLILGIAPFAIILTVAILFAVLAQFATLPQ